MNHPSPANDESTAQARLAHLVAAWNQASFETYCDHFTQPLIDHYNPGYFTASGPSAANGSPTNTSAACTKAAIKSSLARPF